MSKQDTQGKPRRRRYAVTFKRELVERSLQPGASVSGIALDNGINANVLFRWRREQLHAASGMQQDHGAARAALLPVQLIAAAAPTQRATMAARSPLPEGVIEIDIGAARVRLHGAVDEANVRCVLRALKAIA
jgi:transposase